MRQEIAALVRELDALYEKATKGVWENSAGFVRSILPQKWSGGGNLEIHTSCTWVAETTRGEGYIPGNGNADFIVAFKNSWPTLRAALTHGSSVEGTDS